MLLLLLVGRSDDIIDIFIEHANNMQYTWQQQTENTILVRSSHISYHTISTISIIQLYQIMILPFISHINFSNSFCCCCLSYSFFISAILFRIQMESSLIFNEMKRRKCRNMYNVYVKNYSEKEKPNYK